jgi:FkbM family methyltransferase
LGDTVVMTAAVRDLHLSYPGVFQTSVETSAPEVWQHNPYISRPDYADELVSCDSVELDRSGSTGRHYVHAYLELLNRRLGTHAQLTAIKGNIHLSAEEKGWYSDVWSLCRTEIPFWLIGSGGKFDIPIKWWHHERYQEVVNAFRGRIQFVQVGWWGNHHPKLEGTIDLRGKTNTRDLIHLTYYAQGVLCGVTSLMHLAAAVPTEHGGDRPAVIVGGAREPSSWEAYPHHDYLSTTRNVPCACCWRSAVKGTKDACVSVKEELPECMDLITAEEVIHRIERLHLARRFRYLSRGEWSSARLAEENAQASSTFDENNITELNAPAQAERFLAKVPSYPAGAYNGRGVVICGGGTRYFPLAWVCIRMLRQVGCNLPIELWHYGPGEIDSKMAALVRPFGVRCVDANEVRKTHPMRNPLGWELKSYALLHSSFREVLLLDSDNVPVKNPEYLFETPEYRSMGAVFWPDYGSLSPRRAIWRHCGIPYRQESEFESGQMLVDKERCWRAANLAWWYNDHSEFYYRYIHGDKDTFHMAWRKLNQPYAMIPHPIVSLEGTMCQHDFDGARVFQHRNTPKFNLHGANPRLQGFLFEDECLGFLDELRQVWSGRINGSGQHIERNGWSFRTNTVDESVFHSVVLHNEYFLPKRLRPEDTIVDIGAHIGSFALACHVRGSRRIHAFEPHPGNWRLARKNTAAYEGIRVRRNAVLDRQANVSSETFPAVAGFYNTGGTKIRWGGTGVTRSIAINDLLAKLGSVTLMKLDCEGSEWPILMNGTAWDRVGALCGEYHLFSTYVKEEFGISKTLAPETLFDKLKMHFPYVWVEAPNQDRLGRFWASRKKHFFASVARRVSLFQTNGG